jgi:hypothetical protein
MTLLSLSPSERTRLIACGAMTVAAPRKPPENIVKDGPRRKQGPRLQNAMLLAEKQAHIPPLCSKSGCELPCKYYDGDTPGKPNGGYGCHCVAHAAENARRTRAAKILQKQRDALRMEARRP